MHLWRGDEMSQDLPYIQFEHWKAHKQLIHCFTTKLGGVSQGEWMSLNLGFNGGDEHENVVENYKIVCRGLEVPFESLVLSKQIHENHICEVKSEDKGNGILQENKWSSADGIYTSEKDITLVTHYADCVPLFFYAPKYPMVGMAHAGWRGTVGEIGKEMAKIWHETHGIAYEDIEVVVGPSIGPCCFEVHDDVASEFINKFGDAEFIVENKSNGKYNINLWECNKQSLLNTGILEENIYISEKCTCCMDDVFFSHRKTQGRRGTLGAFMALR